MRIYRVRRMGIEFLTHVERADAAEFLDIKRGVWPLEKVKSEPERLFQQKYVIRCSRRSFELARDQSNHNIGSLLMVEGRRNDHRWSSLGLFHSRKVE